MENLAIKITNEVVENLNPEYIEWDDVYPHVLKALTEHNHSTKVVNSNRAKEVPPKQGMSADEVMDRFYPRLKSELTSKDSRGHIAVLKFAEEFAMHQYAHQSVTDIADNCDKVDADKLVGELYLCMTTTPNFQGQLYTHIKDIINQHLNHKP